MSYTSIIAEQQSGILIITLNRPQKLNAFSPTLLSELDAELAAVRDDDGVRVVVIRAAGRVFSAGYDLSPENWIVSQFPADHPQGVDRERDRKDIHKLLDYWLALWRYPKPIICQVEGPCLSGAGELLAVADLVIASPEASFGHPAARDLGIPPTLFFWPLLIGLRKTKELLFTGESISAQQALELGLINTVVNGDEIDEHVLTVAANIARSPANHLTLLKQSANNWFANSGIEQSAREAADLDAEFHQSPTFQAFFNLVKSEGMQAALAERKKRFG